MTTIYPNLSFGAEITVYNNYYWNKTETFHPFIDQTNDKSNYGWVEKQLIFCLFIRIVLNPLNILCI